MANQSLSSYVENAASAGVPRDQLEKFGKAGYISLPWALSFHSAARQADNPNTADMIGCGGARGPGKSTAIMAQIALDDCQRQAELKCLFLRKVQKMAGESFDDLVLKVCRHQPHQWKAGNLYFPDTGSRILVGGYNTERDIDKYLGLEYDVIALEEGTQITGEKREKIRGSLRTSKANWRTRWYESTNPGGIGHLDFKTLYVLPHRNKKEKATRFFPSTYRDNPFLKPEYIAYLESLTGDLGRAWRDGDWDVFEGQAFPSFNYDVHVIEPVDIPSHWSRWRAVDWGYANPFCCLWLSKDPDIGRVYVYREVYQAGLTDRQQAELIKDNTGAGETINITYADPSMWTRKNKDNVVFTTADEYRKCGVPLTQADNDRLNGKRKVGGMLASLPDGLPALQIFSTCRNLAQQMPSLIYDRTNVEDVDSDSEDHAYDTLRYGLTKVQARPDPQANKPTPQAAGQIERLATLTLGLGSRDL